jgi:malate permease and related proteins
VLLVALTAVLATGAGILLDRHTAFAGRLAHRALTLMLYVLIPLIAYVSFAHIHISVGGGVGLAVAYAGLACSGVLAWAVGRRIGIEGPALGALLISVILVNTTYLGYPMTVALLGAHALPHAVVYDQVVSTPILFTAGFAIGAAFGHGERPTFTARAKAFLTRNPPLAAAVAGLIVPASFAPAPLVSAAHAVVDALLVVGFVVVGVYLSSERREDGAPLLERPNLHVGTALAARFVVTPLLLGAVALAGVAIPGAFLLQAAMPSAIGGLIVGHAFGLDQRLIATVIVWSTILVLVVGVVVYVV